jgi:hypothetical protein
MTLRLALSPLAVPGSGLRERCAPGCQLNEARSIALPSRMADGRMVFKPLS